METKSLRLEGSSGKTEYQYNLELDIPSKLELLELIGRPPFYIFSKRDVTFSTGVLAHVPHAVKLQISREYQEPFIGIFIQLKPKSEELIDILDIKGTFLYPVGSQSQTASTTRNIGQSSSSAAGGLLQNGVDRGNPHHPHLRASAYNPYPPPQPTGYSGIYYNPGRGEVLPHDFDLDDGYGGQALLRNHSLAYSPPSRPLSFSNGNNNNEGEPRLPGDGDQSSTCQLHGKRVSFKFSKTASNNFAQQTASNSFAQQAAAATNSLLNAFDYYESRCQWPDIGTKLYITIRVSKTNFSVIVNDEDGPRAVETGFGTFDAKPYLLSEEFSDVKIKAGSEVIPAHKIILSGRSNYFAKMFASQMRENVEGVVQINDVDGVLLKKLIGFIYTGKVESLETYATDLLLLADKYDMADLASFCENFLLENLSVDNAIEMYDISHMVGRKGSLAKKSKELIMWNKDKFAGDLDTFKEFSLKYPDLIFELLKL